ncbi:MAG: branched-chain amino acid ABC transporter permease [Aquisalimonadaceae bacterium]
MSNELVTFLQQIVNGLAISSVYVLVGLGLTLVFGLTRLINFAHGQFVVLGAFVAYSLVRAGLSFWLAIPVASLAVGLLAFVIERVALRRSLDNPLHGFIVSLGLVIMLQTLTVMAWSAESFRVDSPLNAVWNLGGVFISAERLLLLGLTAGMLLALWVLLTRTNLGRSMRAVAENREAALLMGINVSAIISFGFVLSAVLAASGGAVLGAIFPFNAYWGTAFLIKGLAVALVGGLGSITGALVAGLILGMTETLAAAYGIPTPWGYQFGAEWRDGFAFLLMIAILLWRPEGLFSRSRVA